MTTPTYSRALSIVLAAAMIPYSVGCYSYSGVVNPEEHSTVGSEDIVLVTKSGRRYKIYSPWEIGQDGVLFGKGRDMVAFVNTPDSIQRIPIEEIQSINAKELDGLKTAIAVGLGLGALGLIYYGLTHIPIAN